MRSRGYRPGAARPLWMRSRVALAGMRSISLAVDVTNYVMLETGQPLHAFDADRLHGGIVVRRARVGRAARDPRRRDARARSRGPRHRRRLGSGRARRDDGRRLHRGHDGDDEPRPRGRALRLRRRRPGVATAQALLRGVAPLRARRRPELGPYATARAADLLVEHGGGTPRAVAEVDLRQPIAHASRSTCSTRPGSRARRTPTRSSSRDCATSAATVAGPDATAASS